MTQPQLLEGLYAPITSEIGFLECHAKVAADAFRAWQRQIHFERGVDLDLRTVDGTFPTKLAHLLPLTSVERRRFLFLPTASEWSAFIDNGWRGTDAFSVTSYLAKILSCRGLRVVSIPHTIRKASTGTLGRYGATMLEIYSPNSNECSILNIRRTISVVYDHRWHFDVGGEPLDFEQLERYRCRSIRERFTPELLQEYLSSLGIQFFESNFYEVSEPGYLIAKRGPCVTTAREYSLSEARWTF